MSTVCVLSLTVLLAPVKEPTMDRVQVRTSDGAVLQGLRHPRDGTPVILLHGLVSSLHQFDLDEEESPAMAQFLSARGWDVWLFNWRGAGRGELRSTLPPGEERWSADELIVEDLPAIVAHVRKATGKKPHLVGHSLGGMTVAAYLSGATKIDANDVKKGIRIDVDNARRRNAEIHGAVFISAPARLAWPEERRPKALTRLAKIGRPPLRLLLPARISVSSLNGSSGGDGDAALLEKTGDKVKGLLEKVFGQTSWSSLIFGPRNQNRALNMLKKLRGGVLGDTSEDLLLQLAAGAREGTWPSYRGPAKSRIDYAEHYGNITTRILALVGSEDRIADASIIRRELIKKVDSKDRKTLVIDGYGHSDITLDPAAHKDVFTPVEAWMRARTPAVDSEAPAGQKKSASNAEESKRQRTDSVAPRG